jgi:4,5-DOPA dioxygenase extradiol
VGDNADLEQYLFAVTRITARTDGSNTMPVLFVGHGNPMNAIEENEFSLAWRDLAARLPKPVAILCISAHWETKGTRVTAMSVPPTIHDFAGFPRRLFEVSYPAAGSEWLAGETRSALASIDVKPDHEWGLDHGCWSVLAQMYPHADVPVVQLSLDATLRPLRHYEIAKGLAPLREKGVLILGSGNMVHNLRRVALPENGDFNAEFALPWALEANALFKRLIDERRFEDLADYRSLGSAVQLAVPTSEHFLPLLYAVALHRHGEAITYFNDKAIAGSLTMTSLIIEQPGQLATG